jgi:secondary thiamine-phosphate synthase enzyme
MAVYAHTIHLRTQGSNDVHDITGAVSDVVQSSQITQGIATAFVPGSTAGITTIEYESGAVEDLRRAVERLVPSGMHYDHDARWGDGNGFSHVRAALLGPSLSVPVAGGALALGTWQQIILIDFDNRPRQREVIIHVVGEP